MTLWSASLSAALLAVLAFWFGYQRRWMSDDGLIVLRTVRNLLAGNGPVFNVGERVEANTSALWQYLIWAGAVVTDIPLESLAIGLGLALTALGFCAAGVGSGQMARFGGRRDGLVMVPLGLVCYLAVPPARDFASSGLEWGLAICWLGVLWWLLAWWVRAGQGESRARLVALGLVAFWAGLSWLVRPELALYGGLVGLALIAAERSWRATAVILGCGLPVPAAYQIFRMGYYGLLTPHTAVAKSAQDSAWALGWGYLWDFLFAYQMWIPLVAAIAVGGVLWRLAGKPDGAPTRGQRGTDEDAGAEAAGSAAPMAAAGGWRVLDRLRTPRGVSVLVVTCALVHALYVLRVGGDFMHGRMWLIPLFAGLLPVAVVPVADLDPRGALARSTGWLGGNRGRLVTWLAAGLVVIWAVVTAARGHVWQMPEFGEDLGVVDERQFWTDVLGREYGDPPRTAEDFLNIGSMANFRTAIDKAQEDGDAQAMQIITQPDPLRYWWITVPRSDGTDGTPEWLREAPVTAYLVNLGMTSMNAPLEVRVLDTVGLSTPLAARQPRLDDGRIGHDKFLPLEWQLADAAADLNRLPDFVDHELTRKARAALETEDFQRLFASYRAPLTPGRFFSNIKFALTGGRTLQLSPDPEDYLGQGE